jgi:hypothetical protein
MVLFKISHFFIHVINFTSLLSHYFLKLKNLSVFIEKLRLIFGDFVLKALGIFKLFVQFKFSWLHLIMLLSHFMVLFLYDPVEVHDMLLELLDFLTHCYFWVLLLRLHELILFILIYFSLFKLSYSRSERMNFFTGCHLLQRRPSSWNRSGFVLYRGVWSAS